MTAPAPGRLLAALLPACHLPLALTLGLVLALGGCGAPGGGAPGDAGGPTSAPSGAREGAGDDAGRRRAGGAPQEPAAVAPLESLTLVAALALLDAGHPELAGLRLQVEAAARRAEAAGAAPAPEAFVRAENVPLHRGRSLDQGNYLLGIAFGLPLQGRLAAARAVEEREGEPVSRALEARRHALQRAARDAFASALAADRAAALHAEDAEAAAALAALLDRRVALGDLAPDEGAWATLEAARARLEAAQAGALARRARAALAEALGGAQAVASVAGDLDETVGAPALAELLRRVEEAPTVRGADAEVALREAALELARAERIPDLRLELAYRRLEPTNQHGVDAELALPLPFLGGASARADAALLELGAARARAAGARAAAVRRVHDAHARLAGAVERAEALAALGPRAEAAVAAAALRLERGDASALEVLPVRRAAVALGLERVAALADALRAWADLAEALGAAP